MACPTNGDTTLETFHPFYTTFFPVSPCEPRREGKREKKKDERMREEGRNRRVTRGGGEKPGLIAYRPFVCRVEFARPSFLHEAGLFLAGQGYRERGSPLSRRTCARNYCRRDGDDAAALKLPDDDKSVCFIS